MPDAGRGRLDLPSLTRAAADGSIHTVVTALPDLFGRLVGKRIHVRFFLDAIAAGGMHVCDYLLASDMEMDPTPGYAFTNWNTGYCDLHPTHGLAGKIAGLFGSHEEKPAPPRVQDVVPPPAAAAVASAPPAGAPNANAETAPPPKKRGFWGRVFGFGKRDDDKKPQADPDPKSHE